MLNTTIKTKYRRNWKEHSVLFVILAPIIYECIVIVFFKYLYAYTLLKKTTYLHFQHNISAVRIDWTNNALKFHIHLLFMCKYAHFQGNLIAHVFKFASRVRKLANLENKNKSSIHKPGKCNRKSLVGTYKYGFGNLHLFSYYN